ncbi:MAG: response regulator transcription factor [Rhodobacteraceae bacterium]|nr:response regulator transcription factor [Paracoccaceae bacterium]
MRLLLVEDAPDLAEALVRFLRKEGYAPDLAGSLDLAETALRVTDYACVILDLGLPDGSGLDLLRSRRAAGDLTPVIVVTARDQISDRIAGLDAGADDYVTKPFDLNELSARIRSNVRRAEGAPANRLRVGDLVIDRAGAKVCRDGAEVVLTGREWAVLEALLGARGRILSRQALEDAIYAFDDHVEGNAVEVYISRLRQKLGSGIIETRRGLGYILR